jgi:transposase
MTPIEQAEKIIALELENKALREVIAKLQERIAELERRLGLNSQTSSKPPSSDGLKKLPRTQSLRTKTGKKSGGQLGHQGFTLNQVSQPDQIITYQPQEYCWCGGSLKQEKVISVIKRQVFDIPLPKMEVTEHQAPVKECPHCGQKVQAQFPSDVLAPVQYGLRIKAITAYLHNQHFIPEERLSQLLSEVFGCCLSEKTIATINQSLGANLTETINLLTEKLESEPVKHLDETGFRIQGKTNWLHVVSTELLTWYRVSAKRQDNEPLANLTGIAIHDHWRPYFQLSGVEHGLYYWPTNINIARMA